MLHQRIRFAALASAVLNGCAAHAAVLTHEPLNNSGFAPGMLFGQPGAGSGSEVNLTGDYFVDATADIAYQAGGLQYDYLPGFTNGNAVASGGSALLSRAADGAAEPGRY